MMEQERPKTPLGIQLQAIIDQGYCRNPGEMLKWKVGYGGAVELVNKLSFIIRKQPPNANT